ncbi:type II toxin-antitoxin system RelE/ParE family toxin [Blastochloris viridis]|uniref:Death on curing protein n=1 Tax=Blastochloris viridis TaxID=1079 RepID=A0A0H5BBU3_BLAVI|nr:type II toxin-antitoxin system RelE/ParE family toxin [Blastochloris viridis]ALK10395.1 Plasmid stabilization system protein [Blastochloris viridis]BAR99665.1 death on curing protein [Blastochloris viridis]CUU43057.1 Plasmid stabilization system protein [Blastochloris viridis]
MSHAVVRRPRARLDLIEAWSYVAGDSETAADRLLERIERALAMLSENPFAGRARPELAADLRSFPVGNYVLFYRPQRSGIELVRVLSGYRDIGPDDTR